MTATFPLDRLNGRESFGVGFPSWWGLWHIWGDDLVWSRQEGVWSSKEKSRLEYPKFGSGECGAGP